jgi:hypothetical protein
MNERGTELQETANGQVDELIALISTRGEAALRLPCPGREKLGDGTVAACAMHTADNYQRIAGFLRGQRGGGHARIAKFLHRHGEDKYQDNYQAGSIELPALLERLSAGRAALSILADLTEAQLDTVPPASEMKFCDGQRTLQQVLTSLLTHQSHQLDALRTAIT